MRKERGAPPITKGYEWRKRKGMFDSYKAAKQIALLRKNRGITQEELAQRLSVSPQAVSKWENGHSLPEVSILVELAEILRVTVDEILLPVGSPPANANFEHVLLPYDDIADFSGKSGREVWPALQSWRQLSY